MKTWQVVTITIVLTIIILSWVGRAQLRAFAAGQ